MARGYPVGHVDASASNEAAVWCSGARVHATMGRDDDRDDASIVRADDPALRERQPTSGQVERARDSGGDLCDDLCRHVGVDGRTRVSGMGRDWPDNYAFHDICSRSAVRHRRYSTRHWFLPAQSGEACVLAAVRVTRRLPDAQMACGLHSFTASRCDARGLLYWLLLGADGPSCGGRGNESAMGARHRVARIRGESAAGRRAHRPDHRTPTDCGGTGGGGTTRPRRRVQAD